MRLIFSMRNSELHLERALWCDVLFDDRGWGTPKITDHCLCRLWVSSSPSNYISERLLWGVKQPVGTPDYAHQRHNSGYWLPDDCKESYERETLPFVYIVSTNEKAPPSGSAKSLIIWCRHHESNTGPTDYKSILQSRSNAVSSPIPLEICRDLTS
jgi:hypothetical protein